MEAHVKIYFDYFGYGDQDLPICEGCLAPAHSVHHIKFRSQGGSDDIKNLMALCKRHHDKAQNREYSEGEMQLIHNYFMQGQRKIFLR